MGTQGEERLSLVTVQIQSKSSHSCRIILGLQKLRNEEFGWLLTMAFSVLLLVFQNWVKYLWKRFYFLLTRALKKPEMSEKVFIHISQQILFVLSAILHLLSVIETEFARYSWKQLTWREYSKIPATAKALCMKFLKGSLLHTTLSIPGLMTDLSSPTKWTSLYWRMRR